MRHNLTPNNTKQQLESEWRDTLWVTEGLLVRPKANYTEGNTQMVLGTWQKASDGEGHKTSEGIHY